MIGFAFELHPPALPRSQHVGDAESQAAVDQRASLLDVHLQEAADPLQLAAAGEQRVAGDVVDGRRIAHHLQHVVDVQPARDRQAGKRGRAKARAFLVHEGNDRQGMAPR